MKARAAGTGGKIGIALLVVAALLWLRTLPLADWLAVFNDWVQGLGPVGLLVYALAYAVATVLFLPGSLLTLAAGAAFGLLPGLGAVLVGASVGAALSFLVSRHLARQRVEEWIQSKPRFSAVDRAVAKEGWKIVFLTRLSPIFPFNVQNYAYGLTRISFWHYALASAIGIIPGVVPLRLPGIGRAKRSGSGRGWRRRRDAAVGPSDRGSDSHRGGDRLHHAHRHESTEGSWGLAQLTAGSLKKSSAPCASGASPARRRPQRACERRTSERTRSERALVGEPTKAQSRRPPNQVIASTGASRAGSLSPVGRQMTWLR